MLRTALLWGNTITLDADLSKYIETVSDQWVIEGLEVSSNSVAPGKAWVKATRSNGETIMTLVQNTEALAVDTSGTKKIWLEIRQEAIDNGLLNNEDWTWIAEIKTWPTLPSQNFLLLATVTSWVAKDERNLIPKIQSVAQKTSTLEEKLTTAEGKIEQMEQKSWNDSIVISGEFGEKIYNRNIKENTSWESGTKNSSYFQFNWGSIMGFEIEIPSFIWVLREVNLSFSRDYWDWINLSKILIYDNKEKNELLDTINGWFFNGSSKISLPKFMKSRTKYFVELHSSSGGYVRLHTSIQNDFKLYKDWSLQSFSLYTKIEVVSHPYDNIPKIIPVCLSYIDDGERELGKFYIADPEHDKVIWFCATSSSWGFTNKMIDSRTSEIEVYGQNIAGVQFQTLGATSKIKLHWKRVGSGWEFRLRVFWLDNFWGIDKQNIIFTKNFGLDLFGLEASGVELDTEINTQEGVKYAFVIDFPAGNESKKLILSWLKTWIAFTKNEKSNVGYEIARTSPIRIPINSSIDFLANISFNARGNNSWLSCNANIYQWGELIASVNQGMPYAQEIEITINNIPVKWNHGDCFLVVYWGENEPSIKNIKMTVINWPKTFYQSASWDAGLWSVGIGALYFSAVCKKDTQKEKVVNKWLLDIEGMDLMPGSVFYWTEWVNQSNWTLIGTKIQENKMLVEENVKFWWDKSIFSKSSNLAPKQSLGFVIQQQGKYKYVAEVKNKSGDACVFINGVKDADLSNFTALSQWVANFRRWDTIYIVSNEHTKVVQVGLSISDENF